MQNLGSRILTLTAVVLLGALVYFTVFSEGLGTGPNITVKNNQGEEINLSKPMKPVLVNFWATTCPTCISEMPDMAEMKRELGDRFELITVAMEYDPKTQVESFIKANPYPFVFIMDEDGKIAKAFGDILLTPTTFLIAPNGKIVYQHIGIMHFDQIKERIKQLSPQLN